MIEAGVLFAIIVAFVVAGIFLWRLLAGKPKSKSRLAGRVILLSAVIAGFAFFSFWKLIDSRSFQFFGEIIQRRETSEPCVALTFDDGPTQSFAEEILSILREKQIKATFFVTGAELEKHMTDGRRMVSEGHELGNHTYSHDRMIFKSSAFIREEIEKTDQLIRQAGYEGEINFRSPYGKKFLLLPRYLSETGRKNIFWDLEPESYETIAADSEKIADNVTENVRPGSIILLHVMYASRAESMKAVPKIIDRLKAKGYSFKTVSELLAKR